MIYNKMHDFKEILEKVGEGRLAALDVGRVNIGVSMTDLNRTLATPKATIKRKSNERDFAEIIELVIKNKVIGIVIGVPLSMKNEETEFSTYVRRFGDQLDKYLTDRFLNTINGNGIAITYFDEKLTSQTAENMLIETFDMSRQKRKKVIDKVAAGYILEGFLSAIKRA
jgi:putative Holliday junction resolvase